MGGTSNGPSLLNMVPSLWDLFCDWLKIYKPDNWRYPQTWIVQRGQEHGYHEFGVFNDRIVSHGAVFFAFAADPEFFSKLSVAIDKHQDIRFVRVELGFTSKTILDPGYFCAPYIPLQKPHAP